VDARALVVGLPTAEEAKEGQRLQQRGAAAERTSDDRSDLLLRPKRDKADKGEMVQRTQQPIVSADVSAIKKEGRKSKKKTKSSTSSSSSIKKRKKDSTLPSEQVPISAAADNEREVDRNSKKQRKSPSTALDLDITMDIVTTGVEPEKPMAEGARSAAAAADYDDNVWDEHDVIEMAEDDDTSDAGGAQPMLDAVTTPTMVTTTSAEAVWSEAGECGQRSAPTAEASIQAHQIVALNADHNDDVAVSKRTPVGLDLNLELDLPAAPPEPARTHLKPKAHPKEEMDSEAQLWAAAIKAHKVSTVGTVAETCLLLAIVIN
jgi:hypothetical protein